MFPGLTVALWAVAGVLGAVILTLIAVVIAQIFKLKNRENGKNRGRYETTQSWQSCIHRESYMSAHVLLILSNGLGKIEKFRGLPNILSLFRNGFNKFNNTRARVLDSIYHMTLRILCKYVREQILGIDTIKYRT